MFLEGVLVVVLAAILVIRLQRKDQPKDLMLVLGSGGHTTEMLVMCENFNFGLVNRVLVVIARSDHQSRARMDAFI
jgi:hypothetical protein